MELEELLEGRHRLRLKWTDRTLGMSADGKEIPGYVDATASIHDCINFARMVSATPMPDGSAFTMDPPPDDAALLCAFLQSKNATPVDHYGRDIPFTIPSNLVTAAV